MQCHEFENLINQLENINLLDKKSQAHIDSCAQCAQTYNDELKLRKLLLSTQTDPNLELTPLVNQKRIIDQKINDIESHWFSYNLKVIFNKLFKTYRLNYSLGIGLAVVLLLLFMKPTDENFISRYNLTLSGIQEEIALDNDMICEMLFDLGVLEACVDLGSCDTTCDLMIYDLKDEAEILLVVKAFENLNPGGINSNVTPIIEKLGSNNYSI